MSFQPACLPMAIGSFPYKDPETAMNLILKYLREIPLWPQLPTADQNEQMYVQFYEGIPGLRFDSEKGKLVAGDVDDDFFVKMAEIYEDSISGNLKNVAISRDKARGLYYFLENFNKIKTESFKYVKGQLTGPFSFSLAVTDRNMKPILYNEAYRQVVNQILAMKAAWQVEKLKSVYPDVIIFIDEPYMASYGSSMVSVEGGVVKQMIKNVADTIRAGGAIPGVHCCGNTDWSILLETGCDIISLDAYGYGENFALFGDLAVEFIKNGGMIAWGITPTSEVVNRESPESLTAILDLLIKKIGERGIGEKEILKNSFITPSCGLGNIPPDRAERILKMTVEVSDLLRERI